MSELPKLDRGTNMLGESIIVYNEDKRRVTNVEHINEVIHRSNCHDDLVAACEEMGLEIATLKTVLAKAKKE